MEGGGRGIKSEPPAIAGRSQGSFGTSIISESVGQTYWRLGEVRDNILRTGSDREINEF
ncbi:hypothetical protein SDC9_178417 [bioreactor metagenome]|uniref:Uncharacterized protein n=1 Tax=bioreactor metagenome TaxID=1076179 RepID=A0A645GXF9_9ZZZZ